VKATDRFNEFVWLFDGGVPADQAAIRAGYKTLDSVCAYMYRHGMTNWLARLKEWKERL
jgi:hypothetical protein